MRLAIIAALLLASTPAYADLSGCWIENPVGDRFIYTDDFHVWTYQPARGPKEDCAYGLDPDQGGHTITCTNAGIDALVTGDNEHGVQILNQTWQYACPQDLGM